MVVDDGRREARPLVKVNFCAPSPLVTTPHCGTLSTSLPLSVIVYVYLASTGEERTRERDREIGVHPISDGSRDETNTTISRREESEVKRIEREKEGQAERDARVKQEEKRRVTDAGTEWPCSNTDH